MIFGYIRVSTTDQNTDRQLEAMTEQGIPGENIFTDKLSGKDNERPALKAMLAQLRPGDVVTVKSMDRLARSTKGFFEIWDKVKAKGAILRVLDIRMTLDDGDPMTECLVTIMAAFAQLERSMIRERQREGQKLAKERGAYKGRAPDREKHQHIIEMLRRNFTVADISRSLDIGRHTVMRVKKQYAQSDGTYIDAK